MTPEQKAGKVDKGEKLDWIVKLKKIRRRGESLDRESYFKRLSLFLSLSLSLSLSHTFVPPMLKLSVVELVKRAVKPCSCPSHVR